MKKIVLGILAHVDSGKTTLSEEILYLSGKIREKGRVDSKNAYLDNNLIERDRGITIFSKQAVFTYIDTHFTLIDTPGHVDFSAEAEAALGVLDCAVLLISGTDGIKSHTKTLWELLKKHRIPTFIFINKTDLAGFDKTAVFKEISAEFDGICDFSDINDEFYENVALCDEQLMTEFLDSGEISENSIKDAISDRKIFPCFFGSALKSEGTEYFLNSLEKFTPDVHFVGDFGAKIFKISEDDKKNRLTHLKITGGELNVKQIIPESENEKVNEIRIYSGEKYECVQKASGGDVVAVTGLTQTRLGQGIGVQTDGEALVSEPVFNYLVQIPEGYDKITALRYLKKLEEENMLKCSYNSGSGEISARIMGDVQLEIIKRILSERFDLNADFQQGSIIYKETIASKVEGVGHYEPLRHYAEVHLLLEPLKQGRGLVFAADCSEDELDKNWQRLILTHLYEKTHAGVLTGSAITDMKITLKSGRAHLKHTEGGDFRQATYRAVRHGLRCAQSVLLEPWYDFTLEIPGSCAGRAMTDLKLLGAEFGMPDLKGDFSVISGSAPVEKMQGYQKTVINYTKGEGRLNCSLKGYLPCRNAEEVIEKIGYNPDSDLENPSGSVFCAHGAGYTVPWNEVTEHMHLESVLLNKQEEIIAAPVKRQSFVRASDDELMRIFELTYGKIEHKNPNAMHTPKHLTDDGKKYKKITLPDAKDHYLLVDGYNVIFADENLKKIASSSLEQARDTLIDRLCSYKIVSPKEIIVVFDAYKVKGNRGEVEKVRNISVVYTKEAETADAYIEKCVHKLEKKHIVSVATSDALEQLIIFGTGALRIPASSFIKELDDADKKIQKMLEDYNQSENLKNL